MGQLYQPGHRDDAPRAFATPKWLSQSSSSLYRDLHNLSFLRQCLAPSQDASAGCWYLRREDMMDKLARHDTRFWMQFLPRPVHGPYLVLETVHAKRADPSSVMVLFPTGYWPRLESTPPTIDLSMVARWLSEDTSEESNATEQSCTNLSTTGSLQLTVIDCTNCSLALLPRGEKYLALSYVWGTPARMETPQELPLPLTKLMQPAIGTSPPPQLPPTIDDSLAVCIALGYRYLRVDRYCIPQDNHDIRASQINRMDEIYRFASIILIACAGSDPYYGLPGVKDSQAMSSS